MKVNVINKSGNALPQYQTSLAAGLDICAHLDSTVVLQAMERGMIPTGLYLEIPAGYEGQVRPRSGLAAKKGITVLNSPGTIDADYRGEVKVILINLSNEPFEINNGDRIAQLVLASHAQIEWQDVEVLTQSDRQAGGFGSTGV